MLKLLPQYRDRYRVSYYLGRMIFAGVIALLVRRITENERSHDAEPVGIVSATRRNTEKL